MSTRNKPGGGFWHRCTDGGVGSSVEGSYGSFFCSWLYSQSPRRRIPWPLPRAAPLTDTCANTATLRALFPHNTRSGNQVSLKRSHIPCNYPTFTVGKDPTRYGTVTAADSSDQGVPEGLRSSQTLPDHCYGGFPDFASETEGSVPITKHRMEFFQPVVIY